MSSTPQQILDEAPMSRVQVIAVTMCVLLNALDGFDVLSISFASPGIAAEWGIDRAQLGIVLSMELVGMAFGSVVLGRVASAPLAHRVSGFAGRARCRSPLEFGALSLGFRTLVRSYPRRRPRVSPMVS